MLHLFRWFTHTYVRTYVRTNLPTYIPTYLPTYLLPTYLPTYLHTYIPTYLRTYVRTYLRTYVHTYLHTLHYITPHYITFHYIALHYITLHHIRVICTGKYACVFCIHTCVCIEHISSDMIFGLVDLKNREVTTKIWPSKNGTNMGEWQKTSRIGRSHFQSRRIWARGALA